MEGLTKQPRLLSPPLLSPPLQGTPLSLNGVPRIMKAMDWGSATPFLSTGNIGGKEVEGADAFVIVAPQNIVGHSIVPFLEEMVREGVCKSTV